MIWNIQTLRFIAAFMVLISHLHHEVPEVRGLITDGYMPFVPVYLAGGVDIFFVISGFIMYTVAGDTFGQPYAARQFLLRRLVRVVPPYWVYTIGMVLAIVLFADQIAHPQMDPWHIAGSFLFYPVQNAQGQYYPLLMLGWTLNFEMLFYVLFALALTQRRRVGLTLLTAAMLLVAAGSYAQPPAHTPFAFWCNSIVLEFLMGVGLAAWRKQHRPLSVPAGWALMALGAAAMVALHTAGITQQHWAWRWAWMGLPAAAVVAAAALMPNRNPPGPWQRLGGHLGDASFALYLSHPFVLALVKMGWPSLHLQAPEAYVAVGAAASVVASLVLYRWLERPLTQALQYAIPGVHHSATARAEATVS